MAVNEDNTPLDNSDLYFGDIVAPILKRVATRTDYIRGVQSFGKDNLYPQRCIEVMKQSFSLKKCINRLTDFTIGRGFIQEANNEIIINQDGIGGTKLIQGLRQAIFDYSFGDIIALHFNYNLEYRISTICILKQEYCRLGTPDDNNEVHEIKYSTNWEGEKIAGRKKVRIDTYPVFNPDPTVVKSQIDAAGGIANYKGQILYLTPRAWEYPEVTFDAVIDHAQVQGDSAEFMVGITQNAFLGNVGVVYPGTFESEDEKKKFLKYLYSKAGAKNGGKIIGIEDPSGKMKASDMFVNLGLPNSDRQFQYTDGNVRDAIRENYSMPIEVSGEAPDSGMFNQANIKEAFNFYNTVTQSRRDVITNMLNTIFTYWWDNTVVVDFSIAPLNYVSQDKDPQIMNTVTALLDLQASVSLGSTSRDAAIEIIRKIFDVDLEAATKLLGTPQPGVVQPKAPTTKVKPGVAAGSATVTATPGTTQASSEINQVLTTLSGRAMQNFQRIIRQYNSEKITADTARVLLSSGFGLTKEQIDLIIQEDDPQATSNN